MMKLQILGTGCPKCKLVHERAGQANSENGWNAEIEKIEDIRKIVEFGVMQTPALALDGKVLLAGRIPSVKEIAELVEKNR